MVAQRIKKRMSDRPTDQKLVNGRPTDQKPMNGRPTDQKPMNGSRYGSQVDNVTANAALRKRKTHPVFVHLHILRNLMLYQVPGRQYDGSTSINYIEVLRSTYLVLYYCCNVRTHI